MYSTKGKLSMQAKINLFVKAWNHFIAGDANVVKLNVKNKLEMICDKNREEVQEAILEQLK